MIFWTPATREPACLSAGFQAHPSLFMSWAREGLPTPGSAKLDTSIKEALCLELGNKHSLQISYGNQALILQAWGRLEEAFELLKKQEALCLELGSRSDLAYCYANWGLLAREQHDPKTEREKLTAALDIFTELNMPRERDEVRAELEKTTAADRAT
jgi:tetratricopeptide (TPR) repeat protein